MNLSKYPLLRNILEQLLGKEIIQPPIKLNKILCDEPPAYYYLVYINKTSKYLTSLGYDIANFKINGSNLSFFSAESALLKSIMECLEYLCLYSIDESKLIINSYNSLSKKNGIKLMDLDLYSMGIKNKTIGWLKGYDLINKATMLIPAQLTTLNYNKDKLLLTTQISSGSASGPDETSALLHGIYEILERDATMTTYLLNYQAPEIDLSSMHNLKIGRIVSAFTKHKLELRVFNVTNNLDIPSFIAVIRDNTDIGAKIAIGSKSSLQYKKAITGAIEEAFAVRYSLNSQIYKNNFNHFHISTEKVENKTDRLRYWSQPKMVNMLKLLHNTRKTAADFIKYDFSSKKMELNYLLNHLKKKKLHVYCVNNTMPLLKNVPFFVIKAIIPKLQPLYLSESHKEINHIRLHEVADYFKLPSYKINNIPHPFP